MFSEGELRIDQICCTRKEERGLFDSFIHDPFKKEMKQISGEKL